MCGLGVQLYAVGVVVADDIACKFHNSKLHTETQAQEGNLVGSWPLADCFDFAVNAAVAESARDEDAAYIAQISSTLSAVTVSESTHLILTVAWLKIPPCLRASTTLIYAS